MFAAFASLEQWRNIIGPAGLMMLRRQQSLSEEIMDNQGTYQTQLFFPPEPLFSNVRKRLRTSRSLLTAPLLLFILLMLPIYSPVQSAPTGDAHVSLFPGAANHGAKQNLRVCSSAAPTAAPPTATAHGASPMRRSKSSNRGSVRNGSTIGITLR